MIISLIALLIGYILDLIFGDPYSFPHIIRLLGNLISRAEKILRRIFPKNNNGEFVAGIFLVVIMTVIPTIITILILKACESFSVYLRLAVEGFICYQLLATKSLKTESMKVYKELKNNNLDEARYKVSMIVGRDTKKLTQEGITKATVETIAENASDGVIAPMIFMVLGGAPLGLFYKAVNTMDSMVGYKNEKYLYFGRFAARLDDVLNYIPARISAYLMILASFFTKMNGKNAYKIYKRDRYNHSSPNSAHTEAVCAGALEIQLAGDAYYFGTLYKKKTIGDALRPIEFEDIRRTNLLLYTTSIIGITIFLIIKTITLYIIIK
ncbi:adenosylcobinamide-phosphate synthase CbiB [Clostridium vincentii]|uniref:Cobalamin biosynthesis protein CobD n=1 Tax=Clostridium vincentii TaxID=52704 RepID=A0A2T0BCL8_9CLOT|nr:adenosylcobinamide-phosphate synthase CbiB [Clostridium vincentii]PRR81628.1 cobalamin biosynthesis protein [Clostridium vincentii]